MGNLCATPVEDGFTVDIRAPPVDLNEPLGKRDIDLVQQSFAKVATLGADTVGKLIFTKIFTAAPGALQLFSFKADGLDFENLFRKDGKAIGHAVGVVTTVGTAVGLLNDLEKLVPVLQELGLKHFGFSVIPAHYDVVGEALIGSLSDGLAAQFTDCVKNAWLKVYKIIKATMCGVCPYPENLEDGFKVHLKYPPVDVNAGLDERDIDLVQQSFAKAATLGADTVGKLIFTKIFTKAPEALQLFPAFKDDGLEFTHLFRADGKALPHAVNVVTTVGTAVSLLRDLGSLVPVLQGLGLKHHGYSVVPAHYDLVGECVIETLSDGLGAQFTEPVKNAWLKVYGIVKKTMCDACPY